MSQVMRGIVRGRTIEPAADPDLVDGQEVEVTFRPVGQPVPRVEAILRTAGSMADDPEFDAVMEEVQRYRKSARGRGDVLARN